MSELTLDAARAVLQEKFAPWIQDLKLEIEAIAPGRVRLRLPISDHIARVGGMISGQALMALADTAMVFAVASKYGNFVNMASIAINTSFYRAASRDVLCEVRVVKMGRTLAFGEAVMSCDDRPDEPVAQASLTFALAGPK